MKNKIRHLVFASVALLALALHAEAASCTLDIPAVTASQNALNNSFVGFRGYLTFYVTCPEGQAWTLSSVSPAASARVDFTDGAGAGASIYVCRPGKVAGDDCSTYYLLSNQTLATGTGTGAPQQATQLAISGTSTNTSVSNPISGVSRIHKVTSFSPITRTTWFKVNSSGVDTPGSFTLGATVQQMCGIESGTHLSINFNGAASATGSFYVKHACGYGNTPPFTVSVSGGNNPLGEVRRAAKAGGGYLAYRLYWDSSYTLEIGATSNNSQSIVATTTPTWGNKTIYGRVPRDDAAHSPVGNGAYTDVVTVSIEY